MQLNNEQKDWYEQKKKDTLDLISSAITDIIDVAQEVSGFINGEIELDHQIVSSVVDRYLRDVLRIRFYHHEIAHIDCHKISGYLTYWICKLKPLKVMKSAYQKNLKFSHLINENLAWNLSITRINYQKQPPYKTIVQNNNFILYFLYTLHYRPINPDSLSITYYLLDKKEQLD